MLIRIVAAPTTESPIEAMPIRIAGADETSSTGSPVDVIEVEESEDGIPVYITTEKTVENSAGQVTESIPVSGIVAP